MNSQLFKVSFSHTYETTVSVYRRFHRGAIRLFLHFGFDAEVKRLVKSELNARWSQTHKGWYIDDSPEMRKGIIAVCKGRAWYDMREINKYLDSEATSLVQRKPADVAKSK